MSQAIENVESEEESVEHTPEPSKKRGKKDMSDEDSIVYMGLLEKNIFCKVKELLATTSFDDDINSDCVKVEHVFDDELAKKVFKAEVACPVCAKSDKIKKPLKPQKPIHLSFTSYLTPVLSNFKRHVTAKHLSTSQINIEKGSSCQQTIQGMFEKAAEKKATNESIDGSSIDLTNDLGQNSGGNTHGNDE